MRCFMMMLVAVLVLSSAASGEWMMYCDDGDSSAFAAVTQLSVGTKFVLSDFGLYPNFIFDHVYVMFKSSGPFQLTIHDSGSYEPGVQVASANGTATPNAWQYVSFPTATVGGVFWVVVQSSYQNPVFIGHDWTSEPPYRSYYYDGWDWIPSEWGYDYGMKIEYSVALERTSWGSIKAAF